jgi:hypothetical protein
MVVMFEETPGTCLLQAFESFTGLIE